MKGGETVSSVYLVLHPQKQESATLTHTIESAFDRAGLRVLTGDELKDDTIAVIAVGGDGTLLTANQIAVTRGLPLLGVNFGRVGFLTEVEIEQLDAAARRLSSGEYTIEERMMLMVRYGRNKTALALNDAVISRGDSARLTAMRARIGNDLIGRYIADGVIVSSPTGSTGYSLSAGGPIVSPKVDCMVLCPICAHSLQHRPVVVSGEETISLELDSGREARMRLSVDGRVTAPLRGDETITIRRAEKAAKFIRLESKGFFGLVRQKLSEWSC